MAQTLVKAAKDEGSGDNITVIVVFMKDDLSVPVPPEDQVDHEENEERYLLLLLFHIWVLNQKFIFGKSITTKQNFGY